MKTEDQMTAPVPEESTPVRAVDLLYGVFFIGVLLTFSVYVLLTMLLGKQTTVGDHYLTGQDYRIPISDYNEAYYKNTTLQEIITRYDYSLLGKVKDKNILVGKEGFLFEVIRESNNYNYLQDYLGEYAYGEESLESIYHFLKLRQTAYRNQGAEYIVAVIPNAQTVYEEFLPDYLRNRNGQTRLEQLSDYLKGKDDITLINLSDALLAAKSAGTLYNNTEDSLNSLGQYFVYQALYNALPEQIKAGTKLIPYEEVTLYTHYTPGKTLAKTAGLSGIIKNETVSLSNTMEFNYLLQELYTGTEITYAGHNADGQTAGQTILLEFSNEWDKIQLMPYFSSTFDDVVYRNSHDFHMLTVETAQPTLVIQFIHEYELNSLTNNVTAQTYNDGLSTGENPFTTSDPVVISQVWLDQHTVCLVGMTEPGAELTVSGDASEVRTLRSGVDESLFFIRIDMGNEDEVVVRLQASVEEKNRSRVTKVNVVRDETSQDYVTSVAVGNNSRLFATEGMHEILPDTGTLSVMETEIRAFTERAQKQGFLKATEFINVVIPRACSVYASDAPENLQESLKKGEEYRSIVRALYEKCGWTVLDLTEDLRASTDIGKLYNMTSDRWTDYGAYVGYRSLMSYIGQSVPDIRLTPLSSYTRVTQVTQGGALSTMLGLAPETISETLIHLKLDTPEVDYRASGDGSFDIKGAFTTIVSDGSLPVAIVIRDQAGTEMLESMAQHFRVMIVLPEGEVNISNDILTLFDPDYVIRLAGEDSPGLYDMGTAAMLP